MVIFTENLMRRINILDDHSFTFGNNTEVLPTDGLMNISYLSQTQNNDGIHTITVTYKGGQQFYLNYGFSEFEDFHTDLDVLIHIMKSVN